MGNSPEIAADSPPRRRAAARRRRRRAAALVCCGRAGACVLAASVECWLLRRVLAAGCRDGLGQHLMSASWAVQVGWAVSKNVQIRVRPAYPCICYLFLSRYSTDTYRRRIRGVSVSGAYRTRDTWPVRRVRVTEGVTLRQSLPHDFLKSKMHQRSTKL